MVEARSGDAVLWNFWLRQLDTVNVQVGSILGGVTVDGVGLDWRFWVVWSLLVGW